jgi:hypothetical protein
MVFRQARGVSVTTLPNKCMYLLSDFTYSYYPRLSQVEQLSTERGKGEIGGTNRNIGKRMG